MQQKLTDGWTRREVLRAGITLAALSPLKGVCAATQSPDAPRYAYVASSGQRGSAIQVYSLAGETWSLVQTMESHSAVNLALSSSKRFLYVANSVAVHHGLARGSVQAFCIDAVSGRLTLLGCQPLSLSATGPSGLAVSSDGRMLAVGAFDGGVYNLLPIAEDGSLGEPAAIFKETGSGLHAKLQAAAHPHTLLFDPVSGDLVSSDLGSDSFSVFSTEGARLKRLSRQHSGAGTGPGAMLLHSGSATMYAWHDLAGTLACYRFRNEVREEIQRIPSRCSLPGQGSLAIHSSGSVLYSACSRDALLTAWKIHATTGQLSQIHNTTLGASMPEKLVSSPDGRSVFVLDGSRGSIEALATDAETGIPFSGRQVAVVPGARSLCLLL